MRFVVTPKMPRLKVPEDPQHAPGAPPFAGKKFNSLLERKAIKKNPRLNKRTFLKKDEQALLMMEYAELPSPSKKCQGVARAVQEVECLTMCKKWNVYP